jgi:MSHA biogenesis protein MshJ
MMDQIKQRLKPLLDRIDALALRERGLLFVGVLAILYFVAANLVFVPMNAEKTRLETQLKSKHNEIQALEAQITALATGDTQGAGSGKKEKLTALQERLRVLDETLGKVTSGLVSPKEMTRLVEQVLLKSKRLEIVKLESLPPAPLVGDGGGKGGNPPAASEPAAAAGMVYKHGMRIELKGSYLDILSYLRALEGLPWKVFWGQATLQTEKYPVSHITLLIYTLSTREGWIAL